MGYGSVVEEERMNKGVLRYRLVLHLYNNIIKAFIEFIIY